MKKTITASFIFITLFSISSIAQIDKKIKTPGIFKDSLMTKTFTIGTLGNYLQNNKAQYERLTQEQKNELQKFTTMDYKIISNGPTMRLPPWFYCRFRPQTCGITVTKNNFASFHPCGVAVSKLGKVAISTYEGVDAAGNEKDGQVFIWKSFADFNNNKIANYQFQYMDPEAVVFDNTEGLFIASTSTGTINYLKDFDEMSIIQRATPVNISYKIDDKSTPSNWNPRGMTIDGNNNLYVMCENLWKVETNSPVETNSQVVKISNPTTVNNTQEEMVGAQQKNPNALGICLSGNKMFTTDYRSHQITGYTISGINAVQFTTLAAPDPGGVEDIAYNGGQYAYFTNAGGYLVKWNIANNVDTKNIEIGTSGIYLPWGVALVGNNVIVADAANNKVRVFDVNNGDVDNPNPQKRGWQN